MYSFITKMYKNPLPTIFVIYIVIPFSTISMEWGGQTKVERVLRVGRADKDRDLELANGSHERVMWLSLLQK